MGSKIRGTGERRFKHVKEAEKITKVNCFGWLWKDEKHSSRKVSSTNVHSFQWVSLEAYYCVLGKGGGGVKKGKSFNPTHSYLGVSPAEHNGTYFQGQGCTSQLQRRYTKTFLRDELDVQGICLVYPLKRCWVFHYFSRQKKKKLKMR